MIATLVLLVAVIAFFEALSRSTTPRAARPPLGAMSAKDHLAAAWAGLVLLTDLRTRGRAVLETPVSDRHRRAPGGVAPRGISALGTPAPPGRAPRRRLHRPSDAEPC